LFYALVYDDNDDDDAGPSSGAGTNLKVGSRHMSGAKRRNFFCRAPTLFGFTSTISRFGDRFRDGQCSLDTFLFFVLLPSHL